MKNTMRCITLIALLLALLCAAGLAETFEAPAQAVAPGADRFPGVDLAAGYIRQMMPAADIDVPLLTPRNVGGDLTGNEKRAYDALKPLIQDVAAGRRADTQFTFSVEQLFGKSTFTAADLGVDTVFGTGDALFDQTALDRLFAAIAVDWGAVQDALLLDCPYEMYWFDKTQHPIPTGPSYGGNSAEDAIILSGNPGFSMPVSEDYAAADSYVVNEYGETVSYTYDPSYGQAVTAAAANAAGVVSRRRGESDLDKLTGYKDDISAMVDYNHSAVEDEDTPYGNPWQLVWVFDGDAATKVVCEGYAKAFQYLCDLTDFDNDAIIAITVTGDMDGGTGAGGHMWNVMHMDDGKNYLVDVTNCDSGSIGYPDRLFLKGYSSGSLSEGYRFRIGRSNIDFYYDGDTRALFPDSELVLSDTDYVVPEPPVDTIVAAIDAANFPDDIFRAWVLEHIDDDGDGQLSSGEADIVTGVFVPDMDIATLAGLEYFPNLAELDASGNALTGLDLSGFADLNAADVDISGQTIDREVRLTLEGGRYIVRLQGTGLTADRWDPAAHYTANGNMLTYNLLPNALTWYRNTGLSGAQLEISCALAYEAPAYYETTAGESVLIQAGMHVHHRSAEGRYTAAFDGTSADYTSTNGTFGFQYDRPGLHEVSITDDEGNTGTALVLIHSNDAFQLPARLTTIGEEVFMGSDIVEVTIRGGVTAIGARAFANCEHLRLVTLHAGSIRIDNTAFENCPNLVIICPAGSPAAQRVAALGLPVLVK